MTHTYKLTKGKYKINITIENTRKSDKDTCYVPQCCTQLKPAKRGGFTKSGWYETIQQCANPECKNFGFPTKLARGVLETANDDGKVKIVPPSDKRRSRDREDHMTIDSDAKALQIDHDFLAENDGLYKVEGDNDPNFGTFKSSIQGKMVKVTYEMQANEKRGWIYGHNGDVFLTPVADIELKQAKKKALVEKAIKAEMSISETRRATISETQLAEAWNL